MSRIAAKGYRVVQERINGKDVTRLEKIPFYGRDASAKIRGRKSKKVRCVHPSFSGLQGKAKP